MSLSLRFGCKGVSWSLVGLCAVGCPGVLWRGERPGGLTSMKVSTSDE